MGDRTHVLGLFKDPEQAVSAIRGLEDSPWKVERVHSPFSHEGILGALKAKKSRVGYFSLGGGVAGFLAGLALSVFTATRWDLLVSGKPIVAWIPFLIIGFEFTILFSVLGNIMGLFILARLPDFKAPRVYDGRCSSDRFGVVAGCASGEEEGLRDFFEERGGEGVLFEEDA